MPSTGREYATIPVNVPATVPLEVSFDGGLVWHPATRPTDWACRILVAGPNAAPSTTEPTVALHAGYNPVTVRLAGNPELVIREAGTIFVFTLRQ